ncbi:c-type cytochrome, partial [bacterium]
MRPLLAALVAALVVAACDRPPAPTREWKPDDHDQADNGANLASGAQAAAKPKSARKSPDDEAKALANTVFQKQCASCHGQGGKGDGPTGPMVQAPDLTDEALQA